MHEKAVHKKEKGSCVSCGPRLCVPGKNLVPLAVQLVNDDLGRRIVEVGAVGRARSSICYRGWWLCGRDCSFTWAEGHLFSSNHTLDVENEEIIKTDRTLVIRLTELPVMLVDSPLVGGKHCRWLARSDGCSES
jgi:hypothetical protein